MPNAVNLSDEIQNMNSHAAMLSKQHKTNPKMSAYTLDPISVEECKKSEDWSAPQQGNSWKQTIMSKIDNLLKFKVFNTISLSDVPFSSKIFPIICTFLTKRTKESSLEQEETERRKARMCLGGHLAIEGVHYQKMDAYAPVPTWATIKLQLALTSCHKLQLRAFDCVAAYLQAELKEPIYARPPKDLMSELGTTPI